MTARVKLRHFATSIYAKKFEPNAISIDHVALHIQAFSEDEALGIAYNGAEDS
jgi:hypothetical protein